MALKEKKKKLQAGKYLYRDTTVEKEGSKWCYSLYTNNKEKLIDYHSKTLTSACEFIDNTLDYKEGEALTEIREDFEKKESKKKTKKPKKKKIIEKGASFHYNMFDGMSKLFIDRIELGNPCHIDINNICRVRWNNISIDDKSKETKLKTIDRLMEAFPNYIIEKTDFLDIFEICIYKKD